MPLPIRNDSLYLGGHFGIIWSEMAKLVESTSDYPYSLLVYGESGVGKSTLAKQFVETLNQNSKLVDGITHYPALYVKLSVLKSPIQFITQLLWQFGVTKLSGRLDSLPLMERLKVLLKNHNVQVVVIDEMQNSLPLATGQRVLEIAKTLTELIDDTRIPFILLGTPALLKLKEIDKRSTDHLYEEQLSRRFKKPIHIPHFPIRIRQWIEIINFLAEKKGIAPLTTDHITISSRLHIATKGKVGLLQKLFSLLKPVPDLTSPASLVALAYAYKEGFSNDLNPFDPIDLTDKDVTRFELSSQ